VRSLGVAVLWALLCASACSTGGDGAGPAGPGGAATGAELTAVSQNVLHGYACPSDSANCRAEDRMALLVRQIGGRCPDIVGLQEMNQATTATLKRLVPAQCGGRYTVVSDDDPGLDREVVLTTDKVLAHARFRLAGPLRTALWVRVAAGVGVVDFWTTHLASSSDDRPCDPAACPPPCAAGDKLNACQARQLVQLADEHRAPGSVVILGGDLNAHPGEPTVAALTAAGYTDTHLAAGNAECVPSTAAQCTSGRDDTTMADITDPASRQSERIDFLFVDAPGRCRVVKKGTGLFNATAAVGDPAGLAFPSDHTGVAAMMECDTTPAQRRDAARQTVVSTSTSTAAPATVDGATGAAIAGAFTTVFGGGATVDQKLAALESPGPLEQLVRQRYEQTASVADRIVVRLDGVTMAGTDAADVTFTLLLDGNAVLDHLPGRAVKVGDQWRVANRTFCDLATTGTDQAPAACQ